MHTYHKNADKLELTTLSLLIPGEVIITKRTCKRIYIGVPTTFGIQSRAAHVCLSCNMKNGSGNVAH